MSGQCSDEYNLGVKGKIA